MLETTQADCYLHAKPLDYQELGHAIVITEFLSREEALQTYAATVNQPGMLFSIDGLLPGRLKQLRELLHDPVTEDEAMALNDVLHRRRRWTDMIAWLKEPTVSWPNHFVRQAFRAEEEERRLKEYYRAEAEKWLNGIESPAAAMTHAAIAERNLESEEAKARYLQRARPCPRCGTPPDFLEWFYYCSPPSFLCRAYRGWATRCLRCVEKIDFFWEWAARVRRVKLPL